MIDLFTSQLFLTCLSAWVIAHVIKLIIALIKGRSLSSAKQLFDSGGFPSGHTTLVSALFFSVGINWGWTNPITTLAGVLAIIVIYDALNIRFQSGLHAKILNKLGAVNPITKKPFKENLGHSYAEVAGGFGLGITFAIISYIVL
jgi:acid phosphatase family membrane protein YuiD